MDKEKIRMIVRNMDLLVQSLRHEIEGPPMNVSLEKEVKEEDFITPYEEDYDEVFSE